jgi:hypothetical protein
LLLTIERVPSPIQAAEVDNFGLKTTFDLTKT